MKIIALTRYPSIAASTRQRFTQYFSFLEENGVQVDLAPFFDDAWMRGIGKGGQPKLSLVQAYARRFRDMMNSSNYDMMWIAYETFPYLPGIFELIPGVIGKPYIVDYDDAIFHNYDAHGSRIVRGMLGGKLERLLGRAAAVTCGNTYLQDYTARFCETTMLLPTVVDCTAYRPADPPPPGRHQPPVLGWIGSPTTWKNVEPLLDTIQDVCRRHGAAFHVVGAGERANGVAGIRNIGWQEAREVADVQAMDVGIMPLLDRPFERGKCGYKLIQYMACGLPVIASPVGVNGVIVEDGVSGLLADTPGQWASALDRLLGDEALRSRMGRAGRARIVRDYSLEVHRHRLRDLFFRTTKHRPIDRDEKPCAE